MEQINKILMLIVFAISFLAVLSTMVLTAPFWFTFLKTYCKLTNREADRNLLKLLVHTNLVWAGIAIGIVIQFLL